MFRLITNIVIVVIINDVDDNIVVVDVDVTDDVYAIVEIGVSRRCCCLLFYCLHQHLYCCTFCYFVVSTCHGCLLAKFYCR